jgi:pectate lyase
MPIRTHEDDLVGRNQIHIARTTRRIWIHNSNMVGHKEKVNAKVTKLGIKKEQKYFQ